MVDWEQFSKGYYRLVVRAKLAVRHSASRSVAIDIVLAMSQETKSAANFFSDKSILE